MPTPSQRSKDGPQPDADAVDDDGDVAGDEDDGVDVRGDHLPPRWLGVDKFSDNPSVENASAGIFQTSERIFPLRFSCFKFLSKTAVCHKM